MPIAVGSDAPDFTLSTKTSEGIEQVSLKSHRGQDVVVLLFFPAAYTSVCTQEFCNVSGGLHGLEDAVVYGISADLPFALEAWATGLDIKTTLLSDHKLEVTRAYDVVWPNFGGVGAVSARAAIVIDRNGRVVYSEQTPSLGDLPRFSAVQTAIERAVGA